VAVFALFRAGGHSRTRRTHATSRSSRATQAAVRPYPRPRVLPGAPGSAHGVLYRFALAYGDVAAASAGERERALIAMAGPPLADALRQASARAGAEVNRGLPVGARLESTVVSLQFGAASPAKAQAAVVLEQQLVRSDGKAEPPVQTSYVAELA